MSLSPITSAATKRRFAVYDFEWVPGTLQMRICGLYDPEYPRKNGDPYYAFKSIGSFLQHVLSSQNRGKWFYAHAGGLADVQFVLEHILKRSNAHVVQDIEDTKTYVGDGIAVEAKFSGSSAVIVHVRQGKNVWHFVDSYWLLRDSLAKIGKAIGLAKAHPFDPDSPDYSEEGAIDWYRTVDLAELIPYNRMDCLILYTAIDQFQTKLMSMGGQLQMTLASCAMQLFKRSFLSQTIQPWRYANECAQHAYFASRVEVLNRQVYDAYFYDINSSFPYSMTFPCPGNFMLSRRYFTDSFADDRIFIADCEIEVPDTYFTPVPYRHPESNRVFFPTGKWRSWFTSIDLELMMKEECKVTKVHEALYFEPFTDLADYSNCIYAERKKCEPGSFMDMVYKLLLNALYGKFAESSSKTSFVYNPPAEELAKLRNPETGDLFNNVQNLFSLGYLVEKDLPVPHAHVPISAHVTARSRMNLFNFMSLPKTTSYCDTDGFDSDELLETSDLLGAIKLEKLITYAEFLAPKVYEMHGFKPNAERTKIEIYKAKGMSLGKSLASQRKLYGELKKGEAIPQRRMTRIRQGLRRAKDGNFTPKEESFDKKFNHTAMDKRFFYPDGHTRPWQIEELRENLI